MPRIQVITRKAYGGAYVVMNSKSIGADLAFAWPSAELAVMGPQGAVEIVYRRELQDAADPVARRAELVDDYTERFANPYVAAERGFVDDVIDPAETRRKVIAGLDLLQVQARGAPPAQAREHPAVSQGYRSRPSPPSRRPRPSPPPSRSPGPVVVAAPAGPADLAVALLGPLVVQAGAGAPRPPLRRHT